MQAVVLAGGAGTRLRPLTTAVPKALLPIVGRPMVGRVIDLLDRHGFERCLVTLQHQASVVLKYFSVDANIRMNVRFVTEPRPLGTAGSVRYAGPWLDNDDDVLVIAGDCLTDIDVRALIDQHRAAQADVTIALARRADPRSFGAVSVDATGRVTGIIEKPSWGEVSHDAVSTGIYVVSPRVLELLDPAGPSDWALDVIPELLRDGAAVYAFHMDGYWEDVGSFASYMKAQRDVLDKRVSVDLGAFEVASGVHVAAGAEVSPDAVLRAPAFIGPFAKIESDCIVGPYAVVGTNSLLRTRAVVDHSLLHPNVFVGDGAEVRGAIIGRGSEVREGARILPGAVVADGCSVMDGAVVGTDVMIYPGKTIDEGTVVDESIVWESASQRQLFSDGRVTGIVNVDMTPERIVRLAAAFATTLPKGATVTVGRDHSRSARALTRALAGALTASGMTLRDLRTVTTPLVRNDTARYSDGGVMLRTTPGRPDSLDVQFLDSRGAEISAGQRDAVERVYTRKEFRRPIPADIGDVRSPDRILDEYAYTVEQAVDLDAIRTHRPRMVVDAGGGAAVGVLSVLLGEIALDALTIGMAVEESSAADVGSARAAALRRLSSLVVSSASRIGVRIGPMGERLSIVDERGHVMDDGRMLLVLLDLIAAERRGGVIAVPVTTSRLAEQVAAFHGASIRRIGAGGASLAEAAAQGDLILAGDGRGRFVIPEIGPGPDAVGALLMLLSLMSRSELSLSELDARIPSSSMAVRHVDVPWHRRADAMRAIHDCSDGRELDTTDGLRLIEDDGSWCLVLPEDSPSLLLVAEGIDPLRAQALVDHWAGVIQNP